MSTTTEGSVEQRRKPLRPGRPRVAVVMPALNAGQTLEDIVGAINHDVVDEIVLVDDKSSDNTVELARRLNIRVIWHPHNVGYGGNQKTCYLDALQRDPDIVVMLHPDGQYEPTLLPKLIAPILRGEADLVLGSRMAEPGAARAGGMPLWKRVGNRFLTNVENRALGLDLSEMHTGYRAFSRQFLLTVPFLRNSLDFTFDSEILMQAAHFGFRIAEVPARSREPFKLVSLFAGFAFIRDRRELVGVVTLDLFVILLGGAVALLPIYARDILRVGPEGLGVLRSASAVGALASSILLSRHPLRRHVGRILFAAVTCFGVATTVFAVSTSLALSLVALALCGAADALSVVIRFSLVQIRTPAEMRGRVSSVNSLFVGASNTLGDFEAGVTAAWFGAVPAVLIGGIGAVLVALIWMRLFPELMRIETLDTVKV